MKMSARNSSAGLPSSVMNAILGASVALLLAPFTLENAAGDPSSGRLIRVNEDRGEATGRAKGDAKPRRRPPGEKGAHRSAYVAANSRSRSDPLIVILGVIDLFMTFC